MKRSRFFILIYIPILIINLTTVFYDMGWMAHISALLIYIPLLLGFSKKLDFKNLNLLFFLGLNLAAGILDFFEEDQTFYILATSFRMISYFFLVREALKYTTRETANKFMLFFFFLLVIGNAYFVFEHLQELETYMTGILEFGFYSMYYINLLILSIVALIYYLNSYSRKSVFFVCLVMAFVISDILRDMALFYLPDISVLIMKNFLSLSGLILAFQFYATREKKLRLINLV